MTASLVPAFLPPGDSQWMAPAQALQRFVAPRNLLAHSMVERQEEHVRHGFRVGGMNFLILEGTRSEIVTPQRIAPLPNGVPWLSGMANLRGRPVPVFDLSVVLELEFPARERRLVLILDQGADALGVLIDRLPEALRGLRPTSIPASLPSAITPFIAGAYIGADSLWVELDHQGLFSSLADAQADHFHAEAKAAAS